MKKTSIFLTIGLVLVAILAGCNNEVVYPHFPTNAVITQTGDFIKGQVFDNSKFQVTVYYLDGSKTTIKNPALQINDTDGIQGGETVTFNAGNDYYGEQVTQTATVSRVYDVDYITAETAETGFAIDADTFATGQELDSELFTVTAYYNAGQSVVLGASNYTVEMKPADAGFVSSEDYKTATEVPAVAKVTLVGSIGKDTTDDVEVTATKGVLADVTAEEIASIESVTYNGAIYAWTYDEVPEVTFDDVTISVKLNNGKTVELASDPGVTLTLVDTDKKLPLDKTTFESGDEFQVKAELEGVQGKASSTYDVVDVEVSVAAVPGYEQKNFTAGEALPELSLDDFIVDYKLGSTWYRADDSVDVELFYSEDASAYKEITDETKLSDTKVFVYASVNGVVSTVEVDAEAPCAGLVGKAAVPATVESIDVAVAAGFAYPAKMAEYNTVPTISASDVVVTATYSDKTTNTVTPTLVAYSTTEVSLTEVTKTSFNGTDKLYIYVEYGEGTNKKTDYVDVTSSLVDAYANDLVVDIAYDDEMVNAAGEPMVGAEVTATVKAINENGVVAVLESGTGYEVIAEEDSIPAAVAAKPFTFKVTAKVAASESTSAYLTSEEYTIAAGHSWIDGTALVTANAFGFVETYKPLIDTPLSGVEGNIAVLDAIYGSDKVAIKQGLEENAPVVTITAVSASGKDIAATGNTVLVTLEWIGSDGETDTKQVEYTFEGVNWIEPASTGFVILYDGEEYPVNDFPVSLNAFPVANFTIDTESYENHDSASAPTITKIVKDDVEYTSGQSITGLDVPGRVLNVVVSYNNGTADVEQTIVLTTGATTTLQ